MELFCCSFLGKKLWECDWIYSCPPGSRWSIDSEWTVFLCAHGHDRGSIVGKYKSRYAFLASWSIRRYLSPLKVRRRHSPRCKWLHDSCSNSEVQDHGRLSQDQELSRYRGRVQGSLCFIRVHHQPWQGEGIYERMHLILQNIHCWIIGNRIHIHIQAFSGIRPPQE